MQITVLPLNRTSSSRSPLNFNNNQACLRQEVKENTEKEVQATPTETTDAAHGSSTRHATGMRHNYSAAVPT